MRKQIGCIDVQGEQRIVISFRFQFFRKSLKSRERKIVIGSREYNELAECRQINKQANSGTNKAR